MRKGRPKKRLILPDPKFNDTLVTKFVNNLMWNGKKSLAFNLFYEALEIVDSKKGEDEKSALEIWKTALSNVMPHVEVRSRRVGGATFQIPMPVRSERKVALAMKWMITFTRKRNEKSFPYKLAGEILAAYKEEGGAVKKKTDTHRMAEANKAFSHFRF
jgi:small subunit ribosomal protein S7